MEQVLCFFVEDGSIGISGNTEWGRCMNGRAGDEHFDIFGNDIFQRCEDGTLFARYAYKTLELAGDWNDNNALRFFLFVC